MATGDLTNNVRKLQKDLKQVKYDGTVDINGLAKGKPADFLPIYHHAFTTFSPAVAEKIAEMDVELFGKSDVKFIDGVYRVLRDMFGYKPPITKTQFFSSSFAEKKIIMCSEVLSLVHQKHRSLMPKKDLSTSRNYRVNSSLSSQGTSKVGFAKPKESSFLAVRADSAPAMREVRKVAEDGPSRPTSARSSRPNSGAQKPPPAAMKVVPQEAALGPYHDNIAVPKTPGIRKAKSSAVKVVYVPRANNVDPEEEPVEPPIEIMASSPKKREDCNVEIITGEVSPPVSPPVSQLQSALEKMTDRLTNLQDRFDTATASLAVKLDNTLARLCLLENRVSIIESKLLSEVHVRVPPSAYGDEQIIRQNPLPGIADKADPTHVPGNESLNGSCPSPIQKDVCHKDTNGHVMGEEASPPVAMEANRDKITEVKSSTPVEKSNDRSLPYSCISQADQEKAQRLEALMKDTQGMLKSVGQLNVHVSDNILNEQE